MKQAIADMWCSALRSDDYVQTQGYMRRTEDGIGCVGYCCLGVLEEQRVKAGIVKKFQRKRGHEEMPTQACLTWAGLPYKATQQFAEANDDGATFKDIAMLIEAYHDDPRFKEGQFVWIASWTDVGDNGHWLWTTDPDCFNGEDEEVIFE